jgi:hypothetical protein
MLEGLVSITVNMKLRIETLLFAALNMLYIKVIDLQCSLARVYRTAEIPNYHGNISAKRNGLLYLWETLK